MSKTIKKSVIEKVVMDKIEKQEIKMKPHYYYILLSILGVAFVAIAGLAVAYFMSVVSLWLRIQDSTGPAYGARRNLSNLVADFPWWALILGIALLIASIYIIRRIGVLYKLRLVYLVPIVILLAVLSGIIFSYTALPNTLKNHSPRATCGDNDADCFVPGNGYMRNRQMK